MQIETWKSNSRKEEIHHYTDDGTYLFGFSTDLLGKKLYKIILKLVKDQIKIK